MKILDKKLIKSKIPKRDIASNKGDFGKVFNIVGSDKYIGAGLLSSLASLKTGAGYSILNAPECVLTNISPDLIYTKRTDKVDDSLKQIEDMNINAIVMGCGIGTTKETIKFVKNLLFELRNSQIPIVIDADGLNCLSSANIKSLPQNTILTPHPKELSLLLDIDIENIQNDREKYINIAHEKYNAVIILKGNKSLIKNRENIFQNSTGCTSLSKAGTGDVLSGMIGGFLAQKTTVTDAAILGVYLHGLAGDLYAKDFCEYSMLASDLLNYIPFAFKNILGD